MVSWMDKLRAGVAAASAPPKVPPDSPAGDEGLAEGPRRPRPEAGGDPDGVPFDEPPAGEHVPHPAVARTLRLDRERMFSNVDVVSPDHYARMVKPDGDHMWVVLVAYQVAPWDIAQAVDPDLKPEDIVAVDRTSCYWCELPWNATNTRGRCLGRRRLR